jgi:hypothetical protein
MQGLAEIHHSGPRVVSGGLLLTRDGIACLPCD